MLSEEIAALLCGISLANYKFARKREGDTADDSTVEDEGADGKEETKEKSLLKSVRYVNESGISEGKSHAAFC